MYPFHYSVSFHVSHPSIDPQKITEGLCVTPTSFCMAGDAKRTPAGTPLAGKYTRSHWYCEFSHPDGMQLSEFLKTLTSSLDAQRSFLGEICRTGGALQLSVGWYSGSNSGDEFDWELLRKLADLKISLSLDVYAEIASSETRTIRS